MRKWSWLLPLAALALLAPAGASAQSSPAGSNIVLSSVEGRVVGPDGKPVERAIVRLLDEGGIRETGRVYTDSSGRFKFTISAGQFIVEVEPVGNPELAKARQAVLVNPAPGSRGGERTFANFFLKPLAADRVASRGPRFEQEVPPEAQREYDRGVKLLATNTDEAYAALRKAIEAYPDYYAALEALGTAYAKDNHDDAALAVLTKAVEVNPKGERSHYALGVILYKKGRFDLSSQSFQRADAIVPDDPNTLMYLGLALVRNNQNAEAEQALKRAYQLGAKGVPELHLALTQVYINGKRHKEAAEELKLLLKETPNLRDKDKIKALIEKYEKAG